MIKLIRRWWWSRFAVEIPHVREDFEKFASRVLTTFGLEDSLQNHELMASMTFRLDFKHVKIVPKFYFDSIHRLRVNEMLYTWAAEMKERAKEEKKDEKIDEAKLSLLKQGTEVPSQE